MHTSREVRLPMSELVLSLHGFGVSEAALDRFAPVFTSVWLRILDIDREQIEAHWRATAPRLELQVPWFGDAEALASTEARGTDLKFDWTICQLLPDEVLCVPIAHEMGHVYQSAIGKNRFNMTPDDLLGKLPLLPLPRLPSTLVELHADEMVERWGFDHVQKDAYLLQHYEVKNGAYVPRKKARSAKGAKKDAYEARWMARYDLNRCRGEVVTL